AARAVSGSSRELLSAPFVQRATALIMAAKGDATRNASGALGATPLAFAAGPKARTRRLARAESGRPGRDRLADPQDDSIWRRLRCSTCVGLPLDPNVNTQGIRSRGSGVQVRPERKALADAVASHLLLRVESNGS